MPTFTASSSADDVLEGRDLRGKRVLITGCSVGGLGSEMARSFATHGAHVIATARDPGKPNLDLDDIARRRNAGAVETIGLDLASLHDVRACSEALVARGEPLDIVITNAGVMAGPLRRTADGFELQFGVNYLGHFELLRGIGSLLGPASRVVCVASAGHRRSDIDLDDLSYDSTPYDALQAYGRSKTAVILFANELNRRQRARVTAMSVHPGAVLTDTVKHMIAERISAGQDPRAAYRWKTVPQGAATCVWAAVAAPGEAVGGAYCEDCHVADVDDDPQHTSGVRSYALDADRAMALWKKSEELIARRST